MCFLELEDKIVQKKKIKKFKIMSDSESEDEEDVNKIIPETSPIVSITILIIYILLNIYYYLVFKLFRFVRSTLYLMMKIQIMYWM